jgi:predicted ATPase
MAPAAPRQGHKSRQVDRAARTPSTGAPSTRAPSAGQAAQAVVTPHLPVDTLAVITDLINKSLLRHESSKTAEPRFRMLETVREYAWEQLIAAGEEEQTRDRHLEYVLALAEQAKGQFSSPPSPRTLRSVRSHHASGKSPVS